eukprot:PhF_6_TR26360/c2_g1_i2/m.37977
MSNTCYCGMNYEGSHEEHNQTRHHEREIRGLCHLMWKSPADLFDEPLHKKYLVDHRHPLTEGISEWEVANHYDTKEILKFIKDKKLKLKSNENVPKSISMFLNGGKYVKGPPHVELLPLIPSSSDDDSSDEEEEEEVVELPPKRRKQQQPAKDKKSERSKSKKKKKRGRSSSSSSSSSSSTDSSRDKSEDDDDKHVSKKVAAPRPKPAPKVVVPPAVVPHPQQNVKSKPTSHGNSVSSKPTTTTTNIQTTKKDPSHNTDKSVSPPPAPVPSVLTFEIPVLFKKKEVDTDEAPQRPAAVVIPVDPPAVTAALSLMKTHRTNIRYVRTNMVTVLQNAPAFQSEDAQKTFHQAVQTLQRTTVAYCWWCYEIGHIGDDCSKRKARDDLKRKMEQDRIQQQQQQHQQKHANDKEDKSGRNGAVEPPTAAIPEDILAQIDPPHRTDFVQSFEKGDLVIDFFNSHVEICGGGSFPFPAGHQVKPIEEYVDGESTEEHPLWMPWLEGQSSYPGGPFPPFGNDDDQEDIDEETLNLLCPPQYRLE